MHVLNLDKDLEEELVYKESLNFCYEKAKELVNILDSEYIENKDSEIFIYSDKTFNELYISNLENLKNSMEFDLIYENKPSFKYTLLLSPIKIQELYFFEMDKEYKLFVIATEILKKMKLL